MDLEPGRRDHRRDRDRVRLLRGVRRVASVLGFAIRTQGAVHHPDAAPYSLPGPDRRGRRRASHLRRSGVGIVERRRGDDGHRQQRPAHPPATRPPRSGRGCSWRAISTSTCIRALRASPTLTSGTVLPAANTVGAVQLDRVLSALTSNTRANLQTLLQGFGAALDGPSTPAQDATQDPSVRGLTAGQALNLSLKYAADAFKASAIVNQALLGQPAARPLEAWFQVTSRSSARSRPSRPQLASLVTLVRHDDGGARLATAGPQSDDRAAATAAAQHQQCARSR